ncbi:hypothetical protein [Terricaulis sp.]|uniref:hypothetical protein n=1 Tax=Terricaulis sp. TaxID=2768686 RepID=UPI00378414C7
MDMRVWLLPVMLAVLTACGEARNPSGEAEASEPALLLGAYKPESSAASWVTGAVTVQRGGLTFEKGAILYTRTLNPRHGYDLIARGGASFAAAALGASDLDVELRRVTQQVLSHGAEGVCGDDPPSYVALAYQQYSTQMTLLVFTGAEAPGADAVDTRVCATFVYGALDGARTRQGVVLR